jgi:hypothetical protein
MPHGLPPCPCVLKVAAPCRAGRRRTPIRVQAANHQPGWATPAVGCRWPGGFGTEQEPFTSDRRQAPIVGCYGVGDGVLAEGDHAAACYKAVP